jgi:surfeit locus 1 family protein
MRKFFAGRRWILTLLVPVAAAAMIRLGIWQLDRLEQRRAYNHQVRTMTAAEPVELSGETLSGDQPAVPEHDLTGWEYRSAEVSGTYDHEREIVIRNQAWDNRAGVHVLTPLRIQGMDAAVLVDRGWLPQEVYQQGDWKDYREAGQQHVRGLIRLPQSEPALGGQSNPQPEEGERIEAWLFVELDAIESQLPYPLLPVYLQKQSAEGDLQLPYTAEPEFELTEGPHLGYAVQWFGFAAVLSVGYPIYIIRKQEEKQNHGTEAD